MKEVFVLGGTGFLGYYTTLALLKGNYQVTTVALPPLPDKELLPKEVHVQLADITLMKDEEIVSMLKGKYGFIYAAGADERVVPDIPACKFFYEANVLPTQRLARLAKQAGVKKFVVFGSYFSHFSEIWPELKLHKNNAYPRTRLLQEEVAYMEGEGSMDVCTLRLPYIFGTMPGRMPLWTMFTEIVKGQDSVFVPLGGTAMVTVQQVAEAAVGAMENGMHKTGYAIGELNMKYADFYKIILEEMGQSKTQIQLVDLAHMKPGMVEMDKQETARGKEHGICMADTAEIQARDAYIDPEETKAVLQYKSYDVVASLRETIRKCIQ